MRPRSSAHVRYPHHARKVTSNSSGRDDAGWDLDGDEFVLVVFGSVGHTIVGLADLAGGGVEDEFAGAVAVGV